jgi:hypothetical protein
MSRGLRWVQQAWMTVICEREKAVKEETDSGWFTTFKYRC